MPMPTIHTVIIGFTPLTDLSQAKPRQIKEHEYFINLVAQYALGEVHYTEFENYRDIVDKVNPFFIITFDEMTAHSVKEHKKDVFFYVIDSPGSVFYRKATAEEKQERHRKVFEEIVDLIRNINESDEKGVAAIRKYAGMEYKEIYDMLIQMIISDNETARKQAWELLSNNNGHSMFIWMRAQLLTELWSDADGKGKEEFLCLAMKQHIDNGFASKIEDFTDEDGQQYHQYMFQYVDGSDTNYIRRIPFGYKGQGKYEYEALLKKYETPIGVAMMLEAGQLKSKREEIIQN
ncbi:MAG TPA: hypothetical protein PK295_01845 [Candidatus Magasanikbacteria bacterium]|nr:hypothetical protein [Candidatus Magasanikbacteria bacterium]